MACCLFSELQYEIKSYYLNFALRLCIRALTARRTQLILSNWRAFNNEKQYVTPIGVFANRGAPLL